jgi:hypothetical protein
VNFSQVPVYTICVLMLLLWRPGMYLADLALIHANRNGKVNMHIFAVSHCKSHKNWLDDGLHLGNLRNLLAETRNSLVLRWVQFILQKPDFMKMDYICEEIMCTWWLCFYVHLKTDKNIQTCSVMETKHNNSQTNQCKKYFYRIKVPIDYNFG